MDWLVLFGAMLIVAIGIFLFECNGLVNAYEDLTKERTRRLRLQNDKLEAELKGKPDTASAAQS